MASRLIDDPQVRYTFANLRHENTDSASRIFHVIVSKFEELFERDTPSVGTGNNRSICPDDYKECNYLLRTASNIISTLSPKGWITLLSHTLGQLEKRPGTSKSDGKTRWPRKR